ncbi:lamin-B2-like isoform X2 [Phycodurus eques]|uniref:lamin-B2-like isoform X2 n=1 Tax=Phycodurus eques TaxID=693459 RepID=UPI002ACE6133|nr:lamin-B2-like isoform X2 [Phycodurus eques]
MQKWRTCSATLSKIKCRDYNERKLLICVTIRCASVLPKCSSHKSRKSSRLCSWNSHRSPRSRWSFFINVSPSRIPAILQEKQDPRHLKGRLAVYNRRVRVSEKQVTGEVSRVKRAYEAELADARRLADESARERARLKFELEEAARSGKKKDADLAAAVSRASALESQLKRSDVTLAMALSVDAALKALLDKAEDAHAVARRQLKVETSMRVDLENRCQELEFRKNKFEEVRESRRRQEQRIVEVDSGARQDYEFKLSQALQDLRKQHDDQVTLYKEELEQTFQAKLDNAKVSSAMNDKAVRTAREELQESRMRIEGLAYQLSALQKQAAAAEDRVRELEDILSSDRDKHRRAMEAKDREMNDLRQRMNAQLSEYQELLDVKLTLDMEIDAYRKLLDGKQHGSFLPERLPASPFPGRRARPCPAPPRRTCRMWSPASRQRSFFCAPENTPSPSRRSTRTETSSPWCGLQTWAWPTVRPLICGKNRLPGPQEVTSTTSLANADGEAKRRPERATAIL